MRLRLMERSEHKSLAEFIPRSGIITARIDPTRRRRDMLTQVSSYVIIRYHKLSNEHTEVKYD